MAVIYISKSKKVALMGIIFSLMMVLSVFESYLSGVMMLPPGVRIGLANVMVMYVLFTLGRREAVLLTVMKGLFAFVTRGFTASVMSLCGGTAAILVIIIIRYLSRNRSSVYMLGICGALAHNVGQILSSVVITGTYYVIYYLPVLIISGIAAGVLTSVICKESMRVLKLYKKEETKK